MTLLHNPLFHVWRRSNHHKLHIHIRKSKDYVYGIWVYKVLGIWKGYYRVKKSLVSCMKPWTDARNNKYMKRHSNLHMNSIKRNIRIWMSFFRPLFVFNFISMGHTRPNMFCNTVTQVILQPEPILRYLLQQKPLWCLRCPFRWI